MQKRDLVQKDLDSQHKELDNAKVKIVGLENKLKKVQQEKSSLALEKTNAEKSIGQLNQKIILLEKDVRNSLPIYLANFDTDGTI